MRNSEINKQFLAKIDKKTSEEILSNIANHYGITKEDALTEVTDIDAENLLEYITGPQRSAASALMQRYGLVSLQENQQSIEPTSSSNVIQFQPKPRPRPR